MSYNGKVLIVPSWYPTTPSDICGSFFREQAIALAKSGIDVGVIYPQLRSLRNWRSIYAGPYGDVLENDCGVHTYRSHSMSWFPRMPSAHRWLWLREGERLFRRYVSDHGLPDLIHVHSMLNAGLLALHIARQYFVPYVVTEHSSGFSRGLFSQAQLNVAREVAHGALRCFAVSEPFCDLLAKELGREYGSWEVMPNIVEQNFLDSDISEKLSRNKEFIFLTIALLTENKCINNLIKAFASKFSGKEHIKLIIGGHGNERARLDALVLELGLQSQVRFLGSLTRTQVIDAMADADVFVLPSRYETFGVVIVEALALGKPVIATRCGGPEYIVETGDGVLVPVDDVAELAVAMEQVRTHIASYEPQEIRARCRERFSEDAIVSRLKSVYQAVDIRNSVEYRPGN